MVILTHAKGHRRRVHKRLHALVYLNMDLRDKGCILLPAHENLLFPIDHFFAENWLHVFQENDLVRLAKFLNFLWFQQPACMV